MIEKQIPSEQNIIHFLETAYKIKVIKLAFLPLGADMDATIYKATTYDKSYFVKLNLGYHHDNNIIIMELLYEAGIQVILPLKAIDGQSTQRILDFSLIVYPFVEGQDAFCRHLTDHQWQKLGKSLRLLHEINVPASIQSRIRHEAYSPKWREIVRSHYIHIESETFQDEIALKLSNFIKENMPTIQRLVNRAEELAEQVRNLSPKFVLCHSDIHGGNVLIDENDTIYIVDWDDPILAPKERDLMFIGGGVANVWNKPHEEELFYKGYGKTEINKIIIAYYRHERIVEDIAQYIQGLLLTDAGGADRHVMYNHFIDMFVPNGVVDIALKTGKI